jgi:hypothetical protein
VPPSQPDQKKALAFLDRILEPWSGGEVSVRGSAFSLSASNIMGRDFSTNGGKISESFVSQIKPSAGFVVFLRTEHSSSIHASNFLERILTDNRNLEPSKEIKHVSLHLISWGVDSSKAEKIIEHSECTLVNTLACSSEFKKVLDTLNDSIQQQADPKINGTKIEMGNWTSDCDIFADVIQLGLF